MACPTYMYDQMGVTDPYFLFKLQGIHCLHRLERTTLRQNFQIAFTALIHREHQYRKGRADGSVVGRRRLMLETGLALVTYVIST